MLDAYDTTNRISHQDDDARFVETEEDTGIISILRAENPKPVFISADVNMYTRKPHERQALAESELTCVFLKKTFHNINIHEQAIKLLKLWPEVVQETSTCAYPTAFEITPAATKLHRLCLTRELAG